MLTFWPCRLGNLVRLSAVRQVRSASDGVAAVTVGLHSRGAGSSRDPTDQRPAKATRSAFVTRNAIVVAVAIVVAAGVAVLLSFVGHQNISQSSDSTGPLLQAKAVLGGNITLSHWTLSLDSFWTVEVPFYVLGIALVGVNPVLLAVVPAVVAALVFLVGLWLTTDRRGVAPGVAAGVTLFVLVALPSPYMAGFLLLSGNHVATALFCLVGFACFRRGRFDRWWVVGVVVLALVIQGDLQALFYGVIPVAAAGVFAGVRLRRWQATLPGVSAAAATAAAAVVLRLALVAIGVYSVGAANQLATRHEMIANLRYALEWGGKLLGLTSTQAPDWLQGIHVLAALLVVVALAGALVGLVRGLWRGSRDGSGGQEGWRTDDLLLVGVFCDLVVFVALTRENLGGYGRYLMPGIVFSAVLAARLIDRLARSGALRRSLHWWGPKAAVLAGACVVVAAFAGGFAANVQGRPPVAQNTAVLQFLKEHHLHRGIGDYWDASILTVDSHHQIVIRPVAAAYDPDGRVERYERMSSDGWYRGVAFQFFVFNAANPWAGDDAASAEKTFGQPQKIYKVGIYDIMTWPSPIRIRP